MCPCPQATEGQNSLSALQNGALYPTFRSDCQAPLVVTALTASLISGCLHNPVFPSAESGTRRGAWAVRRSGSEHDAVSPHEENAEPIPEDVLLYAALCEALMDYTISFILGGEEDTRLFIEQNLVSRTRRDHKIRMLSLLFTQRRPDVARESPYPQLFRQRTGELARMFEYRDAIAHSQPDHGDRFNRLRRHRGTNETVTVSPERMSREIARGMRCQSALDFIPLYLSDRRGTGTAED